MRLSVSTVGSSGQTATAWVKGHEGTGSMNGPPSNRIGESQVFEELSGVA